MLAKLSLGYKALRLAAVSGLLSLALMIWGVIDPRPISLVVAMSVGQALGTAALLVFCLVVTKDLIRSGVFSKVASRLSSTPPPPGTKPPPRSGPPRDH
jgi:hypothetical protein